MSRIVPQRIAVERLQAFFLDDLRRKGQAEALSDDDLMPAQAQLKRIVGDKPITVLLAQMFIDDVIANREQGLLAGSVPELMLRYVRRIDTPADPALRRRAGLVISEALVQRALRVVALASQRQGPGGQPLLQPLEFSDALARAQAEALLGYLIELRLLLQPGAAVGRLRFPLDPLADHLAAAEQFERLEEQALSDGSGAWEAFLAALGFLDPEGERYRMALEALGLTARDQAEHRPRIEVFLERQLRADALDLLVESREGWAEHDRRLPPLQGASRALQLAASAELPLLGNGPGRAVPMLTLTALQEGEALRIRTEVVTPAVWRLPLPGGEQLELVVVEGGEYKIGSAKKEAGRDVYNQFRQKCEGVNVEAERKVSLKSYAMVRHPLSQAQWRAVAALPRLERDISLSPGTYKPDGLWESHAQPGGLAVDSVTRNDNQEWLKRLNSWLQEKWRTIGGIEEPPVFGLPSESQWEAACRCGASTPFHFGNTLDVSWASYSDDFIYGLGREGSFRQRVVPIGAFGLVNCWGLAEMHGQLLAWCADHWHRDPVTGSAGDGSA